MISKRNVVIIFFILVLLLPLWMLMAWWITPKRKLVVAIVDKTVLNDKVQEHSSLIWVLNNLRLTKTATKKYNASEDYFGFFPLKDGRYQLKGLELFSSLQLKQLSNDADLLYFTDTYGIYKGEGYLNEGENEGEAVLYGGMSSEDIQLLKFMKDRHKLILAEFNTIGSPTNTAIRVQFEQLFKLRWSGWTVRYFSSLDTAANRELPSWLVSNYKKSHQGTWPFRDAGLVFVHDEEGIVVLEDKVHVEGALPHIKSEPIGKESLGLPDSVRYPFWFDIIIPDTKINTVAAYYDIKLNDKGKNELLKNGIPEKIPAVVFHKASDYQFYYFSGDFCDNEISLSSSPLKGIRHFQRFFYDDNDPNDRSYFFWKFYLPMMDNILSGYYSDLARLQDN